MIAVVENGCFAGTLVVAAVAVVAVGVAVAVTVAVVAGTM